MTPFCAVADWGTTSFRLWTLAGDGTVLRSSALLDERPGRAWQPRLSSPIDFHSVLLLPDDHLGLTQNRVFRDNVLFWLLEEPR